MQNTICIALRCIFCVGTLLNLLGGSYILTGILFLLSLLPTGKQQQAWSIKDILFPIYLIIFSICLHRSGLNNSFASLPLIFGVHTGLYRLVQKLPNVTKKYAAISLSLLVIYPLFSYTLITLSKFNHVPKRAILSNGNWAYVDDDIDDLTIKTQYSYSILSELLNAELTKVDEIEKYNELWIITPTSPFRKIEEDKILSWLGEGGKLIIISDHTDLFGHAEVLNQLLESLSFEIDKNAIVGYQGGGGTYRGFSGTYNGLTAASISGSSIPFLHIFGYDDGIDYSKSSFFNDFRITSEDRFSYFRCGTVGSHKRGIYKVFSDSTLFSNFGITRPSSQHILQLLVNPTIPSTYVLVVSVAALYLLLINLIKTTRNCIL